MAVGAAWAVYEERDTLRHGLHVLTARTAVPVIGSGMAASYAYHQFKARRVDPTVAKAALTLAVSRSGSLTSSPH